MQALTAPPLQGGRGQPKRGNLMFKTTFTTTVTVERHHGWAKGRYFVEYTGPSGKDEAYFAVVDDFGNLVHVRG